MLHIVWGLEKDMNRGEESAEEVVQRDLEGVQPLFAVVESKGRMQLWTLSEW